MSTAGHPLNFFNVIPHIWLFHYAGKVIQFWKALTEHAHCVLDPVDTDDHTAMSRGYFKVVDDVVLFHR